MRMWSRGQNGRHDTEGRRGAITNDFEAPVIEVCIYILVDYFSDSDAYFVLIGFMAPYQAQAVRVHDKVLHIFGD